ncbi:MAG TPA: HAD family hydrolase [Clostridiales bacterium]|nr:HAD family hydrolase [Clostridiales bacterium]HOL91484.1 HAD family hydrolase [Clostridiales bacterium]HPP36619.1 HAD family hydrolase [Clostridiales bacterium]
MYELIIFDIDGTMIDTAEVVKKSYSYGMYEELGRDLTDEEVARAFGVPTIQAMEILGARNIEKACGRYFESLFKYYREGVPLFEGIEELLQELKRRGVKCGIVTSRNRDEVANDTTLSSVMKYFSLIVTAEDTKKHKPEAEPVLKLMELAGVVPAGVIYIGDTYFDYMCAKNAGIDFALASWGAREDDRIRPDYLLARPADLLDILDRGREQD